MEGEEGKVLKQKSCNGSSRYWCTQRRGGYQGKALKLVFVQLTLAPANLVMAPPRLMSCLLRTRGPAASSINKKPPIRFFRRAPGGT